MQDYARYWFHTPGAQPRSYSNWFGDGLWATHKVWDNREFILGMLPDMEKQYAGWTREHYDPKFGMFKWHGMADGMETNINSRQTKNGFAGAEGFRPTLNSYLYGDALAISAAAALAGDQAKSQEYARKAADIKKNVQEKLWDSKRQFFLHMFAHDEENGIKAGTRTYETGKYAGNEHGREEIGFIPWQFGLPDNGYEAAWKFLMDKNYFFSDFGPTVTERHDPLFSISANCCAWSGNSWPYATSQTLTAMANLLNDYKQTVVNKDDYFKLLKVYTVSHRMDGKPFIAEACHPDTGSWKGHNVFNHSEHYFHSSYTDLVISGLAGLRPRADDTIEVNPLIPDGWAYFALDDVQYHGHSVSILWDRDGSRYNKGKGLTILVDGKVLANQPTLGKLTAKMPPTPRIEPIDRPVNFAVNNDGSYFPVVKASYSQRSTPLQRVVDGNYWYHPAPPNRWTTEDSPNKSDWIEVNFGAARPVESVKLYILDDGDKVKAPAAFTLEQWTGSEWREMAGQKRTPEQPQGHRANVVTFPTVQTSRIRATLTHQSGACSGLTEIEAWGYSELPLSAPTEKIDNLAYNPGKQPFPKATASFTSRFDHIEEINDGKSFFTTNSRNRWTAYESPNKSDWVQIDFGAEKSVSKFDIHLWGDKGGVRAPRKYTIQYLNGSDWADAQVVSQDPKWPDVMMVNTAVIEPVKTSKVRIVFDHAVPGFTGVTELMIWEK